MTTERAESSLLGDRYDNGKDCESGLLVRSFIAMPAQATDSVTVKLNTNVILKAVWRERRETHMEFK